MEFLHQPDPVLLPYYAANSPLPEELTPILETHLGALDTQIDATENDIADTMKQVADLLDLAKQQRERQSKLKVERNAWHTVGKGVRTLPIELLGKIFEVVTTSDSKGCVKGATDPKDLLPLRLVCKHWDVVALSTPKLWSSLQLDLDQLRSGTSESDWEAGMSHLVNTWYQRAGQYSLALAITGNQISLRRLADWMPRLTAAIKAVATSPLSFNITKLSIHYHHKGNAPRQGLEHLSSVSPSLNTEQSQRFANIITQIEELSLSDWTWYNIMTPQYAQAWDNGTLKSLYISNESPAFDDIFTFDGSYLPKSIRFLQLHGTHSLPMNVLSELPMLEELIIAALGALDIEQRVLFTIPHLRHLALSGNGTAMVLDPFLSSLTLPSIKSLRFAYSSLWKVSPIRSLGQKWCEGNRIIAGQQDLLRSTTAPLAVW
ncbi:hypothetical protein BKA70DRAFT_790877 [Coprinopsis sp. MPI-PUGE-AT-0042]|nr:hypothetical protein BKA70DRAFT_790877 [Coprinopsis sp. MPI-PUGE-AT-0042]